MSQGGYSAPRKTRTVPGQSWAEVAAPESVGYSAARLSQAEEFSKRIGTSAVVIVYGGRILKEWGEVCTRRIMFSVRKSFMSALYGKYVQAGSIDLDITLERLGIDDNIPLSVVEKRATVRDVLKACSGVYHPVNYGGWALPERGAHRPGEQFFYNNWDFNVAGAIFEKLTGKKIFSALKDDIADPIGMESFRPRDGHYFHHGSETAAPSLSRYPSFSLRMTSRDMARFGLLMCRGGSWGGDQIIPSSWIEESTRYHSDASSMASVERGYSGYGYMWWVDRHFTKYPLLPNVELPEGAYMAMGAGGHYILILPDRDLVIVHRVQNEVDGSENPNPNVAVTAEEFGHLVHLVLTARE